MILQNHGGRDVEFIIRPCQIGDETALSLLGTATFLETYVGTAEAADILAHVETEHSAESYRTWLQSEESSAYGTYKRTGILPSGPGANLNFLCFVGNMVGRWVL